jgi:prefoldin beta subunit
MEELTPQLQNQIAQLSQVQQQAQALATQKMQVEMVLREADMALEELENLEEEPVIYKTVGEILIRSKKNEVKTDLSEKKETYELRLKTIERQEERIQRRAQQLQQQVRQALSAQHIPAT